MSTRPTPNSELSQRFPGLLALARDYVNLSWDFEFDEPDDCVLSFLATRPDLAPSCADGIDALLTDCPDEPARLRALDELGWGYSPGTGRLDAFLIRTRDTLRETSAAETAAG